MNLAQLLEKYGQQALANNIPDLVEFLQSKRNKALPDVVKIMRQWKVSGHRVLFDIEDRKVQNSEGHMIPVHTNKIPLPMQKRIVNSAVAFAFANEPEIIVNSTNESEKVIGDLLQRVIKRLKINSINRRSYRELMKVTEVAEIWSFVKTDAPHFDYGQSFSGKIYVNVQQPSLNVQLYPFFSIYNDLEGFGRQFVDSDDNTIFEFYTDTHIYTFNVSLQQMYERDHEWGKIPVVYASQDEPEWSDVQIVIERLEYLISKFAETNDYFASPIVFVNGKIKSLPDKTDSAKVIEGGDGTDAKYLSWDSAPDAVRLEIDSLLKFIYSLTQTADISFDSVKGLGSISGIALKILLSDARLKVEEKREILDEYFERRISILKTIIGKAENKFEDSQKLEVTYKIKPFDIIDESGLFENLATGVNAGFISAQTAIDRANIARNKTDELQLIRQDKIDSQTELYS